MKFALLALLLLQDPLTKEDVVKLSKEGLSDEVIFARLGKTTFKLSADEIVALKKDGVSDKVIARMIGGPKDLKVTNGAHKTVYLSIQGATIDVNFKQGEEVRRGATVALSASGEFAVTVEGRETTYTVKTPATLLFQGCDIAQVELLTVQVQDAAGARSCLLDSRGKWLPSQQVTGGPSYEAPRGMHLGGFRHTWLPFASDSMLLGAGAGAIIGHQSGHIWQGGLIGAAGGMLLDLLSSSY